MAENPLVDAPIEIILRDANLEDAGEITRYISFQCELKLNDISSWQIDMQTQDFQSYGIDETSGILFYRDGELILDGPVMKITNSVVSGVESTTIVGGNDLALLQRICYPVVTGPIFDTDLGGWRFGLKRSAVGINTVLTDTAIFDQSHDTLDENGVLTNMAEYSPAVLTVASTVGFIPGNMVTIIDSYGGYHPRIVVSVGASGGAIVQSATSAPLSSHTLIVDGGDVIPWIAGCKVYQTSGTGGAIVNDPSYVGYDTRSGPAENVAKELIYYNAGEGACVDQFGSRAIPYLVVGPSYGRGSSVTANSRGEFLLDQIKNVCISGGLNFEIKQINKELVFDVFYGTDLSVNDSLVFSVDGGNLKDYHYIYGPPSANFIMGAGPQTGIDKLMLPSGDLKSINQYGRREAWISSSTAEAGDSAEKIAVNMVAANNLALAQSLTNMELTLSIQENDQVRFPRDFKLGDKVGVQIGKRKMAQKITSISYSVPVGSGSSSGSSISQAVTKQKTLQMEDIAQIKQLQQQIIMG